MDRLRPRMLQLALSVGLLFALAPTPALRLLVEHLQEGVQSLQVGQAEAALTDFEHALELQPDLPAAHLLAAESALRFGNPAAARSHLESVPAEGSECLRIEVSLALGELTGAVGRLVEANPECLELVPRVEAAIDQIMLHGAPDTELTLIEQMASREPAWAHFRLGQWTSVRDPELALSHLALAAELDPPSAAYLRSLIRTIEQARIHADPGYSLAQVGQFMARSGDWVLAAAAFRNALAIQPDYTEARAYLGLALDQTGADGLEHLQQASAEAPGAALPYQMLGRHWHARGDFEQAVEALERAAELAPEDPLIAVDLGAAYAASGDMIAAKAAYLHAVEVATDEPIYWKVLANFSLDHDIEVGSLGLPAARRMVALDPAQAEGVDLLGYSHYLLGNRELAGRLFNSALQLDPDLASAYYHLGLLEVVLGDLAAGRAALVSAAQLDGSGWIGSLARRSLENLDP